MLRSVYFSFAIIDSFFSDEIGILSYKNLLSSLKQNNKVPSEHYLDGRQYPGEFQIYHYFDKGRGRVSF